MRRKARPEFWLQMHHTLARQNIYSSPTTLFEVTAFKNVFLIEMLRSVDGGL